MSVDKKILEEISKYNNINKYITEQETDLPEPIEGGELDLESPELEIDGVQPVDVESDPDVEVVGEPSSDSDVEESGTEELEDKVEKYRQKSPEEKLQLRSLDSYPYNQKLTDFFMDKGPDMEKTGKNEYVLTSDEVESYSDRDIKDSFDAPLEQEY